MEPSRFTLDDIKRDLCFYDGHEFRPFEDRSRPPPLSDNNEGWFIARDITGVEAYCAVDTMRAMGFRNCDDISQEGEEDRRGTSERQWGETTEDTVRLWNERRAAEESLRKR
jgi:hypothetical protein